MSDRSAYHMMWGTSIVLDYLQLLPRRLTWPEPPETPVSSAAISLARAALGL